MIGHTSVSNNQYKTSSAYFKEAFRGKSLYFFATVACWFFLFDSKIQDYVNIYVNEKITMPISYFMLIIVMARCFSISHDYLNNFWCNQWHECKFAREGANYTYEVSYAQNNHIYDHFISKDSGDIRKVGETDPSKNPNRSSSSSPAIKEITKEISRIITVDNKFKPGETVEVRFGQKSVFNTNNYGIVSLLAAYLTVEFLSMVLFKSTDNPVPYEIKTILISTNAMNPSSLEKLTEQVMSGLKHKKDIYSEYPVVFWISSCFIVNFFCFTPLFEIHKKGIKEFKASIGEIFNNENVLLYYLNVVLNVLLLIDMYFFLLGTENRSARFHEIVPFSPFIAVLFISWYNFETVKVCASCAFIWNIFFTIRKYYVLNGSEILKMIEASPWKTIVFSSLFLPIMFFIQFLLIRDYKNEFYALNSLFNNDKKTVFLFCLTAVCLLDNLYWNIKALSDGKLFDCDRDVLIRDDANCATGFDDCFSKCLGKDTEDGKGILFKYLMKYLYHLIFLKFGIMTNEKGQINDFGLIFFFCLKVLVDTVADLGKFFEDFGWLGAAVIAYVNLRVKKEFKKNEEIAIISWNIFHHDYLNPKNGNKPAIRLEMISEGSISLNDILAHDPDLFDKVMDACDATTFDSCFLELQPTDSYNFQRILVTSVSQLLAPSNWPKYAMQSRTERLATDTNLLMVVTCEKNTAYKHTRVWIIFPSELQMLLGKTYEEIKLPDDHKDCVFSVGEEHMRERITNLKTWAHAYFDTDKSKSKKNKHY
jgi:hypothetical protein